MATVTVTATAKGQVTLRKEVLDHLQVRPGDRLEVDLLPSGRIAARAKPKRPITDLFGMLKREGEATHSVEEINEAIAGGWAGER